MQNTTAPKKQCKRCNSYFLCNSIDITNCFCNTMIISNPAKKNIKADYNDCLCAYCLNYFNNNV